MSNRTFSSFAIGLGVFYPALVYALQSTLSQGGFVAIAVATIALRVATLDKASAQLWRGPLLMAVPALLIVLLVAPDKAAKAYPVAISLAAAAVFGGSLIAPPSLIEQIARLQEPDLPEEGQAYCRKVTLVWTVWLLLNALIAGLLGWTGQDSAWAIWTGIVAYAVMALLFLGEIAIRPPNPQKVRCVMTLWPLDQLFAQRPSKTPVAFSEGALRPFGQLRRDVSACAGRLRQIGGRRALLVTRDAYSGAVGLLALASSGKQIILPPNALAQTLGAIAEHDDILLGDEALEAEPRAIRLCAGDALTKDSLPEINSATPVIFFTSGSTGEPKRIEKTLLQLEDEARSIDTLVGNTLGPEALVLGTVIHQHAYGLAFRLIWPLLSGQILYGPAVSLWEDVLAAMPSGAALVTGPAHLSRVAGLEPVRPAQRPALILSAGAPLGESAAREARAFLTTSITEIFGSTETGAIAWRPRDGQDAPWAPLPDVTITRTGDGLLHALARHIPDRIGTRGPDPARPDRDGERRNLSSQRTKGSDRQD